MARISYYDGAFAVEVPMIKFAVNVVRDKAGHESWLQSTVKLAKINILSGDKIKMSIYRSEQNLLQAVFVLAP